MEEEAALTAGIRRAPPLRPRAAWIEDWRCRLAGAIFYAMNGDPPEFARVNRRKPGAAIVARLAMGFVFLAGLFVGVASGVAMPHAIEGLAPAAIAAGIVVDDAAPPGAGGRDECPEPAGCCGHVMANCGACCTATAGAAGESLALRPASPPVAGRAVDPPGGRVPAPPAEPPRRR